MSEIAKRISVATFSDLLRTTAATCGTTAEVASAAPMRPQSYYYRIVNGEKVKVAIDAWDIWESTKAAP